MRMGESTTQMTVDGGRRDCELAWSARKKKMGAKATPTRWKRGCVAWRMSWGSGCVARGEYIMGGRVQH